MIIDNGTTPVIVFKLVTAADVTAPLTGVTPDVEISKAGGAFATATNSPTEIGYGWYKITLTATETGTNGLIIFRAGHASAYDEWEDLHEVRTAQVTTGLDLSDAAKKDIAYAVLRADMASARADSGGHVDTETDRSLLGALAMDVNRTATDSGANQLVVYEEDGTTEFFRQGLVTTASSVDPVTGRTPV
ncbi:MAG: hypothetical protein KDE20_17525 [Caldilineaceae bacterium]|nr:hypothetical protein [Caldilineaceae bacterium]